AAPPRVSLATPARPLLTGDSHRDRLDPPARASAHITQRSPAPPLGGGSLTRPPDDLLPRRRTHTWAAPLSLGFQPGLHSAARHPQRLGSSLGVDITCPRRRAHQGTQHPRDGPFWIAGHV